MDPTQFTIKCPTAIRIRSGIRKRLHFLRLRNERNEVIVSIHYVAILQDALNGLAIAHHRITIAPGFVRLLADNIGHMILRYVALAHLI